VQHLITDRVNKEIWNDQTGAKWIVLEGGKEKEEEEEEG
jgi:hypothetical protein